MTKRSKLSQSIRSGAIIFGAVLGFYLLFSNTAPLGAHEFYTWPDKQLSALTPEARTEILDDGVKINDDLVYFTTNVKYKYNSAHIKVIFDQPDENQPIKVGYKDDDVWHYNSQTLNEPLLNNMSKYVVGDGPYLYQRNPNYSSMEDFADNPPRSEPIGLYDLDKNDYVPADFKIPDYKPSGRTISLNIPLRGRHVLYAYLNNEPFEMMIEKRDLNWYEDPDPLVIKIYRETDLVYQATINDDGVADASKEIGEKQSISINNPGPELPEPGVYKIVFEANADTVITKLSTNLSRLVFEGPIYPINNAEIYKGLVEETKPVDIYTSSSYVSFQTSHSASLQNVFINEKEFPLDKINKVISFEVPGKSSQIKKITTPKGDVIINGTGFFSFAPDKFFYPLPFDALQIQNEQDLNQVNYVLSNYRAGIKLPNGEQVAELDFGLSDAVIQKGKISWMIAAPGLKENGRQLVIKNIEVSFDKKGWFK